MLLAKSARNLAISMRRMKGVSKNGQVLMNATTLSRGAIKYHCSTQSSSAKHPVEKMEFKAETKRLLDIVAKSLYTDSQVFIRELLSNASDALEKQRFKDQASNNLLVNIELFETKQQIVIEDNGVGMDRQSLIDNLGTIARSGSKEFVQNLNKEGSTAMNDNIIGQFGVGFYSSFIVADMVEVVSRVEGGPAYLWSSDGSGQFEISQVEDTTITRGTRITLHIKPEHKSFTEKTTVQQIVQKYSNFINYPISINGEAVNLVKAIWSRNKNQISEDQYQKFYEFLSEGQAKYQYKFHFASEVPINIKSILYIPNTHGQKFGFSQEKGEVSLYSKKVLIKKNCKDILIPNFLRFVKGVVDCEDIPLNISRETFQDSALMSKLRNFITKKILKELKHESEKNPAEYQKWFKQFNQFIKEGSLDQEFKKEVIELNRYEMNLQEGYFSLNQYKDFKKPTQDTIFYAFSPSRIVSKDSPYIYPLTKAGIPVLIANSHVEEIIFNQLQTFDGLKFANVETSTQDVERALNGAKENQKPEEKKEGVAVIPEEELTPFSLWIKNELQPFVDKVSISSKAMLGPALVVSPISSSMRQMAFMRELMEEKTKSGEPRANLRSLTFEFNKEDQLIVKLNEFRKVDADTASMIIRQVFDNACMEAGIEGDPKSMIRRINGFMSRMIETKKSDNVA